MLDRDRIIVLKKSVYRDSDLIIRGLNTLGAKVNFIAPAALKSRRRFGGGILEPTNFIEVVFQRPVKKTSSSNSGTQLNRICEAQMIKEFPGLRQNYDLIQTALSMVGLMDRLAREGEIQSSELFNLLGHALQTLSQQSDAGVLITFRLHFLLRLLFQQGVLNQEEWMTPFLRNSLQGHQKLLVEIPELCSEFYLDRLSEIENVVQSYIENAAVPYV